jgi:hypothetical protein
VATRLRESRDQSRNFYFFFPTHKVSLVAVLHFAREAAVRAGVGLCQVCYCDILNLRISNDASLKKSIEKPLFLGKS